MITAAVTGFLTAFSLILAIGAQNAFVLRQGLIGQHVFWLCLFCAVSDAILISAGVLGFGALVSIFPVFPVLLKWLGAAFLFVYGILRFIAAAKGGHELKTSGKSAELMPTLAVAAALTWLNPHVYLDTLGLIGAVSTNFVEGGTKLAFALGAMSASFTFFFSLGYGAMLLAPIMQSAKAWRILDVVIGLVMCLLAIVLIASNTQF